MYNPGRELPFTSSQRSLQDLQFNPCNLSLQSSGFSFFPCPPLEDSMCHNDTYMKTQLSAPLWIHKPFASRCFPHTSSPSMSHGCSMMPGGIFCLVPTQDPAIWYQGWSQEWLRHGPWGKESSQLLAGLIFVADWNDMNKYRAWKKQRIIFFIDCFKFKFIENFKFSKKICSKQSFSICSSALVFWVAWEDTGKKALKWYPFQIQMLEGFFASWEV